MEIFKALHILSMFAAVTLVVGEATYSAIAIWRGDVSALAALQRVGGGRPIVGALFFVLGIVFGVLTAATGGLDFLAGWLLAAYVMVAALLLLNASPVVQRGLVPLTQRAVEAENGQRPEDEVRQEMIAYRRTFAAVVIVNVALFVALVLDMVLKPF